MNKDGDPCRWRTIPYNKYCVWHQESSVWFSIAITSIIGLAIGFLVAIYFQYKPLINVICNTNKSNNLSKISCTVSNTGDAESKDIQIIFSGFLPADTTIYSNSGIGIKILKDALPLNLDKYVPSSQINGWYAVYIPRVAPGEQLTFTLQTLDSNNMDVADYLSKVSFYTERNMRQFYSYLKQNIPHEITNLDIEAAIDKAVKKMNFFEPETFQYEKGTFKINYYSEKGNLSYDILGKLADKYKDEYVEIINNSPNFHQPVLHTETSDNSDYITQGLFFVRQFISFTGQIPDAETIKKAVQAAKKRGEKAMVQAKVYIRMPPPDQRIQQ